MDRAGVGCIRRLGHMSEVSTFVLCLTTSLMFLRCGRYAYIDRQDHDEATILECPFGGCYYCWCKECQLEVPFVGYNHSCDGALELDDLIVKEGWKRCPGMMDSISTRKIIQISFQAATPQLRGLRAVTT